MCGSMMAAVGGASLFTLAVRGLAQESKANAIATAFSFFSQSHKPTNQRPKPCTCPHSPRQQWRGFSVATHP